MKKYLFYIIGLLLLTAFKQDSTYKVGKNEAYAPEESLVYRVHYGFLNAGEAFIQVHPELYRVNNRICYKATVTGNSTGAFDMMTTIRDRWGSFIDTATQVPQKNYRDIKEGNYWYKESIEFDYSTKKATVNSEGRSGKHSKVYDVMPDVQDIVSGYYYIRNVDYSSLQKEEVMVFHAFFEDKTYDFKIRYKGKEKISTKFGKINAIRLVPIMPDNGLFNGESSIRFWISDDKNKIPLRIEADMFVGKVAIDLKEYRGLRNPINFSK